MQIPSTLKNRLAFWFAISLCGLVSIALRLVFINQRSLWFDEASSWLTAQFPPNQLFDSLRQSTHVPLYYPILRIWMAVFGDSPVALRGMSVMFGLATVVGCGFLGRKLFESMMPQHESSQARWFGIFCASLCGLNAFQVLASVEARMYSLGTMLQVLSTIATLNVAAAPHQKRRWLWLVAVTLASLYTHHFLALTAGINAMWLLWVMMNPTRVSASGGCQSSDAESSIAFVVELPVYPETDVSGSPLVIHGHNSGLRYWMTAIGCVAVLWLPGLLLWWIQLNRVHRDFWIEPMTRWSVLETCFDFFFSPPPGRRSEFHLAGLAPAVVVAALMLRLLPKLRTTLSLFWMQAILPLAAIAVVSQYTPLWESRYFRFSHVSLLICIALSIWTISPRTNLRIALCVVAICVSLAGSIAFWDWRDIPNRQAVRGAMEMIARSDEKSHAGPGIHQRPVVVLSPMDFIIARYYARQLQ